MSMGRVGDGAMDMVGRGSRNGLQGLARLLAFVNDEVLCVTKLAEPVPACDPAPERVPTTDPDIVCRAFRSKRLHSATCNTIGTARRA